MTDTKHELPEIDWTKPVEVFHVGEWREVNAVMRNHDGSVHKTNRFRCVVAFSAGGFIGVLPENIRNKPEPLEFWVNVYPGISKTAVHLTKDQADGCAEGDRIRCVRMVEAPDQ